MFATYQRLGCSVHASDREVIRRSRTRIAEWVLRDPSLRHVRKQFYRQMLDCHKQARQLVHRFRL